MTPATPLKQPRGGVVVREQIEADKVLPPAAVAEAAPDTAPDTLAMAGIGRTELGEHMDAHCAASILTAQYWKACNGTVEMIRFGAMLMQVEGVLTRENTRSRNDPSGEGPSLMAWLESHCPEVSYKTAMRFKGLAESVKRHCKIPDTLPMDRVLPGADGWVPVAERRKWIKKDRVSELQRAVFELVEGKSAKQLSFELRLFDEKEKGGDRRSDKKLTEEEKHEQMVKAANAVWNTNVEALVDQVKRIKSHMMLTGDTVGKLLTKVGIIVDALNAAASTKE